MDRLDKPFAYGIFVSGDNFTDRRQETSDLLMNFTHGINTILISPRRMGKTSLVHKAVNLIDTENIIPVFMDIYDCRDENDFYNRFSSSVIKAASSSIDAAVIEPEEILNLPQRLAEKRGKHLLICIDEFQQIGEFADSLTIQKRMRGVWQCQQNVSYCLFGSKKHMLENIFQNKRMPFYQFGQMMYLGKISADDWTSYIVSRFNSCGKQISAELARKTCEAVDCYSSYVQQLAWNLFVETETVADEDGLDAARARLIAQNNSFFTEQIRTLTGYQLNFLKAVCSGVHSGFSSEKVLSLWNIGTKSNVAVLKKSLMENELIEDREEGIYMADPVFELWLRERI